MDAERQEDEIRDATHDMARGGEEMEHRLEQLESDIEEAKEVSARRQDAPEKARDADGSETDGGDDDDDREGDATAAVVEEPAGGAQATTDAEAQAEVEYELADDAGGSADDEDSDDEDEDSDGGDSGDQGSSGSVAMPDDDPEARAEIEYELGDRADEDAD